MRALRSVARFWYEFIVGDDPLIALGILASLAATAILAHLNMPAWWLLPTATLALLGLSLARAARRPRR